MKSTPTTFEGWYLKHQNAADTLALIPGRSHDQAFIQVITDTDSYPVLYNPTLYLRDAEGIRIGSSLFSAKRSVIDIRTKDLRLQGEIQYRHRTPPKGDVMGPLRHLALECRHGIISLHHTLSGAVELNGRRIDFDGGVGYIEEDNGRSFPQSYVWIQSNDFSEKCCVMAAIASIPFAGLRFRGVLCVVWWQGVEYRLASYNGAKIVVCTRQHVVIQRGHQRLEVKLGDPCTHHELLAPHEGRMLRTIRETPSCRAHFRFYVDGKLRIDEVSEKSAFEFVDKP